MRYAISTIISGGEAPKAANAAIRTRFSNSQYPTAPLISSGSRVSSSRPASVCDRHARPLEPA
jgi:hypothetical protein